MADRLGPSAWWFVDPRVTSYSDKGRGRVYDVMKVIWGTEMFWPWRPMMHQASGEVTQKATVLEFLLSFLTNFIDPTQEKIQCHRNIQVQVSLQDVLKHRTLKYSWEPIKKQ